MVRYASQSRAARGIVVAGLIGLLGGPTGVSEAQTLSVQAQVGKKLFFDTNLSGSKQMSCATCHVPSNHYAQTNSLPVQYGGPTLTSPGFRAVPTLTYKSYVQPYDDNAANPDGVSSNSPGGGFFWDGRADTLAQQVSGPLLSSFEMDNPSQAAVVQTVQNASYAALFRQAFGANVFSDTATAFADVGLAIQEYELEDPSFNAYTSKFDYYAQQTLSNGQVVTLTASEFAGLTVFNSATKGNCFACHYTGPQTGGGDYLFTDYTYEAIGVPRNMAIPANKTTIGLPTYYDLGLCTAVNPDPVNPYLIPHRLPQSAAMCGMFKVPTLRNVATRKVFMHNGVFTSLAQVLSFYNTRDTNPSAWYPTVNGKVQKFNDLPVAYQANIDKSIPLDGRPVGSAPAMTATDLQNLRCFLETLTDGYVAGVTAQDPKCN